MVISLIIAITNITLTIADLAFNIFFAKITHITTVSGGSILGAHLGLNWDRHCGTPE